MKSSTYYFLTVIISIFFFAGMILTTRFNPNINYETASNSTSSFFGNIHSIDYETIPTIINGMTTITSIIIGFSGAIIGLVYRENMKSKALRRILHVFTFESIAALGVLLVVYYSLLVGDFTDALRYSLVTVLFSICIFSVCLVSVFYRIDKLKDAELQNMQPPTKSLSKSSEKEETQK